MGELNPGINVIASPLFNSQGTLIGSMFIMGTFSESHIQDYGSIVATIAKQFSAMLGVDIDETENWNQRYYLFKITDSRFSRAEYSSKT